MKRSLLLCLLIWTVLSEIVAQRPGGGRPTISISGLVQDADSQLPLEFATISVYSLRDSSLIGGSMSGVDGTFAIDVPPGRYYGVIEYIGYEAQQMEIQMQRDQRVVDLGSIALSASGIELDDVEIRAERSETVMKLDKRVFNVGQDLANRGGSAQDILDNVPSVTVDLDGTVSLRGSSGVRILINGRPSGLAGADNPNGLRSIPSNMIESIEVITNPSARYEAEGMAGIINIILKKETKGGFNGSFDLNTGYPLQAGLGANVNYRKGDINWFATYSIQYRESEGGGSSLARTLNGSEVFVQDQISDRQRSGLSNSLRGGIDYFLNDNESLTGAFLYRISDENNLNTIKYLDYDELPMTGSLLRITDRRDDEREDESRQQYNINYSKKYGKKHELKATVQYRDELETEGSDFKEVAQSQIGEMIPDLLQRSSNDETQRNWLFQLDYEMPMGEAGRFEVGARSTLRDIENTYLVEELTDTEWLRLDGLSNDFNYDENIHAAYVIYGNEVNKLSYQLGLRAEYSDVITELLQSAEPANDRNYTNLFPSGYLNYKLSDGLSIQGSYSRRLRRPRFFDLNPFFTFSDSRNQFRGNPNLDPELTNSYEVNLISIWDKLTLSSSVYHRYTTGVIQRILTFNPDGTTVRQPENLATRKDLGVELTFSYSGISWMRLDGNFNGYRIQVDGGNVSQELEADDFTWTSRLTSRIRFWKGADLQLRMNYRAPVNTTQGYTKSITSIDIGLSKDVSKNITLTAGIRDLLNSRKRRSVVESPAFYRESEFQWRARTANLSLNYRINQKKKRGGRRGGDGGDFEGGEF